MVLAWSGVACLLAGAAYLLGGLGWYIGLKQMLASRNLFVPPVAAADMITGAVIWSAGDVVGQYLARHPVRIDPRQTALVAGFGLLGGLGTHLLLNLPDAFLPVLAGRLANRLLRTAVVLVGGLALTVLFTQAESKARERFRIETYRVSSERWKTADVLLVKGMAAPVKTFVVINLLPLPARVLTEQMWDYVFTMVAGYFMNRDEPLISRPLLSWLRGGR